MPAATSMSPEDTSRARSLASGTALKISPPLGRFSAFHQPGFGSSTISVSGSHFATK